MGQSASTGKEAVNNSVNRCGFADQEYESLKKSLGIQDDTQKARVDLAQFMNCFPDHLRHHNMQAVFFQLGHEEVGESSVSWPTLVASLSHWVHSGISWRDVLQVWNADNIELDASEMDVHVELACRLCFWCAHPTMVPPDVEMHASCAIDSADLTSMLNVLKFGSGNLDTTLSTLNNVIPYIPRSVGSCLARVLLGSSIPGFPALKSRVLDAGLAFLLRGVDAQLWESTSWDPLYRDWHDGRSFNSLLKGVLHYEGPAILVLTTSNGEVFGAVSHTWEDGNGKYGGGAECFLFTVIPKLQRLRPTGSSGNFMYLNARNKHAPRGLGFGGQQGFHRLWLDADFEECFVLQSDATYESGSFVSDSGYQSSFIVSHIEVWGCGGEQSREAQAALQERAQGLRDQARKVDRARMLESDFDKEMFFGNTFKASDGSREETNVTKRGGED